MVSLIVDWLFPVRCEGCGKGGKYWCTECEKRAKKGGLFKREGFEGIISIYKYNGEIRKIIEMVKYELVSDAIKEIANLMVKNLKKDYPNVVKYWQKKKYCLVAIPLSWKRKNWRGFNQSEELVKVLANKLKLEYNFELIERVKDTPKQVKIKSKTGRQKNMVGAFKLKSKKIPAKIILVDDVITSGATMTEAERIFGRCQPYLDWALCLAGVRK